MSKSFDKYSDNSKPNRGTRPDNKKKISEMDIEESEKMTYYGVLGVSENASLSDVKKQFRELAICFHPDNSRTGDATLFALVARAYECLSDSTKRSEYDKILLINKRTKKIDHLSKQKAFEEFIKAQDNDPSGDKKRNSETKHKLEFSDIDTKRNFDRKRYDEERKNPLKLKESSKKLEDLMMIREQDDIELTQKKIFKNNDSFRSDQFNQLFETKYRNNKNQLVPHKDNPSPFNEIGGASYFNPENDNDDYVDDMIGDEKLDGNMYSSLKSFDDDEICISEDDIQRMNSFTNTPKYNENRGSEYQAYLNKQIKDREAEDLVYNSRKFDDYDTDPKMNGYGILHNVGLTGREIEFDEDVDDVTVRKLIAYKKKSNKKL